MAAEDTVRVWLVERMYADDVSTSNAIRCT
jgi:hypothetical protein